MLHLSKKKKMDEQKNVENTERSKKSSKDEIITDEKRHQNLLLHPQCAGVSKSHENFKTKVLAKSSINNILSSSLNFLIGSNTNHYQK